MRTFGLTLLALVVTAFLFSGAKAEKRVALVIGNSSYTNISHLNNPKNDAELMAEVLREVGFEVVTAIDADRRTMGRAVRKFGKALRLAGKDAVGLFYFAGHGVQARGANFLVPVGAVIEDHADLDIEALSASDILTQMESAGNALNLVILDACRNNPFQGQFRSASRGLARIQAASGSLVAFAAAPGQVAADGRRKHSPYTSALADVIREPGLAVEQVFKKVRVRVENETGGAQTPWEESSLRGEFYFSKRQVVPPPVPKPDNSAEIAYWNTVRESRDIYLLQTYLKEYPNGLFATLAHAMIKQLNTETERQRTETAKRQVANKARLEAQKRANELAYWDSVKNNGNPAHLQTYLDRYPEGTFSGIARIMIAQAKNQPQEAKKPAAKNKQVAAVDPDTVVEPAPEPEVKEDVDLPLMLQTALKKAGCSPGKLDGAWGRNSKVALERFARYAKLTLPDKLMSAETLALFDGLNHRVCPLVCGRQQVEKAGRCVTKSCPSGQALNSAGKCTKHKEPSKQQVKSGRPDPLAYSRQLVPSWQFKRARDAETKTPYGLLVCRSDTMKRKCWWGD